MNKKVANTVFSIVAVCIFAVILALPWILSLAGLDKGKPNENRELATFPTEFSNDYLARLNTYMNDHSPMRKTLLAFKQSVDEKAQTYYTNLVEPIYAMLEEKANPSTPAPATPGPGETLNPGETGEIPPENTPDFGGLFGDETEEPTEEQPTPVPETDTPAPTDTPTPTPTPTPTATPTPTPTPDGTVSPGGDETPTPADTPTPTPTATPTPTPTATPTPTPTPTPEPCQHTFGKTKVTKQADCTHKGTGEQVCTKCGEKQTVEIEALGHNYSVLRTQQASFAHDGYTLEKCSRCGTANVKDVVYRTSVPDFFKNQKRITYSGSGFKGMHDWYFYAGDNSVDYFEGNNVLTDEEYDYWMKTYEALHEECERRGIAVVYLIPPNKEQVYAEYMPSGLKITSNSAKRQPVFVQYLKDHNSPIRYLYPIQELKTAKILYETYYQQDTHWNDVGGFVAAMQICKLVGVPTTPIQNVAVSTFDRSGGDLVSLGVGSATTYTGYSVSYKPDVSYTTTYYTNTVTSAGYDNPTSELRVHESTVNNNRKCVIIGDSFRHSLAPFLAKDFRKVTVAHRGDFNTISKSKKTDNGSVVNCGRPIIQDALSELKSGDVLIVMAVERYDSANVSMAETITDFMRSLP